LIQVFRGVRRPCQRLPHGDITHQFGPTSRCSL
jgi:hypothetical protein